MRIPRFGVAALLAILSVAAIAVAEDPPVVPPPAPAQAPTATRPKLPLEKAEVDWYGIYLEGAKVGYARISAEPIERDGKPLLRMHYRMALHMTSLGETRDVSIEEEQIYSAEPLSVLDILAVRQGDCTEHSLLFSTLARAVGIPAREVGGLMYLGDEIRIAGSYGFGGHAWNEVVLDGIWVPVDPTWGQTEVDATHIRQAADGSNQAASLALGGARLKLVSIRHR
jgi:hypothetical protein